MAELAGAVPPALQLDTLTIVTYVAMYVIVYRTYRESSSMVICDQILENRPYCHA